MRALRRILGVDDDGRSAARDTATVRRIAAELEALPPAEARFLAAFAYVLARVARVDLEISREESDEMVVRVRGASSLSEAQATLVVQVAKTSAIALGGTENYLVTRQFRELSTPEQRVELLRCLFAVAGADQSISHLENTEVTAIGQELGFDDRQMASIRAAFRDQLSVLRKSTG
jgi:uncharacterized tellurite resistance protein B-like protein